MFNAILNLFKYTIIISIFSIIILLFLGFLLAMIQPSHYESFFTYNVKSLDEIPAWFIFSLILVFLNGRYLLKMSALEGTFGTPQHGGFGNWFINFPIPPMRILGYNLITIPVLLFAFVLVRWFQF